VPLGLLRSNPLTWLLVGKPAQGSGVQLKALPYQIAKPSRFLVLWATHDKQAQGLYRSSPEVR